MDKIKMRIVIYTKDYKIFLHWAMFNSMEYIDKIHVQNLSFEDISSLLFGIYKGLTKK